MASKTKIMEIDGAHLANVINVFVYEATLEQRKGIARLLEIKSQSGLVPNHEFVPYMTERGFEKENLPYLLKVWHAFKRVECLKSADALYCYIVKHEIAHFHYLANIRSRRSYSEANNAIAWSWIEQNLINAGKYVTEFPWLHAFRQDIWNLHIEFQFELPTLKYYPLDEAEKDFRYLFNEILTNAHAWETRIVAIVARYTEVQAMIAFESDVDALKFIESNRHLVKRNETLFNAQKRILDRNPISTLGLHILDYMRIWEQPTLVEFTNYYMALNQFQDVKKKEEENVLALVSKAIITEQKGEETETMVLICREILNLPYELEPWRNFSQGVLFMWFHNDRNKLKEYTECILDPCMDLNAALTSLLYAWKHDPISVRSALKFCIEQNQEPKNEVINKIEQLVRAHYPQYMQ